MVADTLARMELPKSRFVSSRHSSTRATTSSHSTADSPPHTQRSVSE